MEIGTWTRKTRGVNDQRNEPSRLITCPEDPFLLSYAYKSHLIRTTPLSWIRTVLCLPRPPPGREWTHHWIWGLHPMIGGIQQLRSGSMEARVNIHRVMVKFWCWTKKDISWVGITVEEVHTAENRVDGDEKFSSNPLRAKRNIVHEMIRRDNTTKKRDRQGQLSYHIVISQHPFFWGV